MNKTYFSKRTYYFSSPIMGPFIWHASNLQIANDSGDFGNAKFFSRIDRSRCGFENVRKFCGLYRVKQAQLEPPTAEYLWFDRNWLGKNFQRFDLVLLSEYLCTGRRTRRGTLTPNEIHKCRQLCLRSFEKFIKIVTTFLINNMLLTFFISNLIFNEDVIR